MRLVIETFHDGDEIEARIMRDIARLVRRVGRTYIGEARNESTLFVDADARAEHLAYGRECIDVARRLEAIVARSWEVHP